MSRRNSGLHYGTREGIFFRADLAANECLLDPNLSTPFWR